MSRLRLLIAAAATTFLATAPAHAHGLPSVQAALQTPPVYGDDADRDADADDPAIWVNRRNPDASLVITTKKNAGLQVFDLEGRSIQDIPAPPAPPGADAAGRYNNVDLLGDLAVVSDRGRDRLRFFAVSPKGLTNVTAPDVPRVFSATEAEVDDQTTAYGLATFKAYGRLYAVASQRSRTGLALLEILQRRDGYSYRKVATLTLPSTFKVGRTVWAPCEDPGDLPQVEGMVVDPATNLLYAGQEDIGIWRIQLRVDGFSNPVLIDRTREFGVPAAFDPATEECAVSGPDPGYGGKHLSADVEGLTIYGLKGGRGYLLASSQGDDTYAAYADRGRGRYLGSVTIDLGQDRVQDSDGADVMPVALGRAYPSGLLVTQDGFPSTVDPSRADPTNFKFTPWERFAGAFRPRLAVEPRAADTKD